MPNVLRIGVRLKQLAEHLARFHVARQLDDHAHALAIRFVAQVGDAFQAAISDQLGDALDQAGSC